MIAVKKLVILSCIIPLGILSDLEENNGTEGQEAEYPEFFNIMQNVEVGGPLTSFLHSFPFALSQDTPELKEDTNNESTDDLIHVVEFIKATDHFGTESIFIDIEKDINCKDLDNCKNNDNDSDNVTREGSRSSRNKDSVLGKLIRKQKLNHALAINVTSEESEKIIPDVIDYRFDTNESTNADNIPDVIDKSEINKSSHVEFSDTPQNEAQDRTDFMSLEYEEDIIDQKASSREIIDQMVPNPDIVTQMSTSRDIIETTVENEIFTNTDKESPEIKTDSHLISPDQKMEVESAPPPDQVTFAIHDEMQDFDEKEVNLKILNIHTHSESQGKDVDIILEKEMKVWPTKDGMSVHSSEDSTLGLTKLNIETSEEVIVEPVKEQSIFESIMTMLF